MFIITLQLSINNLLKCGFRFKGFFFLFLSVVTLKKNGLFCPKLPAENPCNVANTLVVVFSNHSAKVPIDLNGISRKVILKS